MTGSEAAPPFPVSTPTRRARVGLFGGTFDPIHAGHLTLAAWARDELALDQVRLIPTGRSWQKDGSARTAAERLAMVERAVAGSTTLVADGREAHRPGNTFTIDTLREIRTEVGPETALVWLLGSDQLHNLWTWHAYRHLTDHAHLAATQRERVGLGDLPIPVETLLRERGAESLPDTPSGAIVFFRMPVVPVSGTVLRQRLALGERPAELVPAPVLAYIDQLGLYGPVPARGTDGPIGAAPAG